MSPHAFASPQPLDEAELHTAPVRYPRPSLLAQPLELPGAKAERAAKVLELETVGDLLEHLPRDRREARAITELIPDEAATIVVQVRSIASRPVRRRGMKPLVEATVADATGSVKVTFFNQPWLAGRYPPGTRLVLHGKLDRRRLPRVGPRPDRRGPEQRRCRRALPGLRGDHLDPDPRACLRARGIDSRGGRGAAERAPSPRSDCRTVRQRSAPPTSPTPTVTPSSAAAGSRSTSCCSPSSRFCAGDAPGGRRPGPRCSTAPRRFAERWLKELLPFPPTGDQEQAVRAIDADLAAEHAMQRLLMGEVGSGKTVVALYTMLRAVDHDLQAALMAPTETLAEQHFATLQALMGAEMVRVGLLTGSTPAGRRAELLAKLGERRVLDGRRHPRAARGRGPLRRARGRGGRRAASVRRAPARRARRQGHRGAEPPRAAHDGDADPAHARARRLRRPRLHRPARAAPGTSADPHPPVLDRGRAGPGLRAAPRGAPGRTAGVRRVPARGGVRGAPGPRRDGASSSACGRASWPSSGSC